MRTGPPPGARSRAALVREDDTDVMPMPKAPSALRTGLRQTQLKGLARRAAGQVRAQGRGDGEEDRGKDEQRAHDQDRLADNLRLRGRAGAAGEVHAQVAVLVLVATIGEPVRGKHGTAGNERAGGDEGHQAIAADSPAQQMRNPPVQQAG